MTSNSSSSSSARTRMSPAKTLEAWLSDPDSLRRMVAAFRLPEWEEMEQYLLMARQAHLEGLADSDDPEEREAHRIIAKWLKHFLTIAKDEVVERDRANREPEDPSLERNYPDGGDDYQERSGASDLDE